MAVVHLLFSFKCYGTFRVCQSRAPCYILCLTPSIKPFLITPLSNRTWYISNHSGHLSNQVDNELESEINFLVYEASKEARLCVGCAENWLCCLKGHNVRALLATGAPFSLFKSSSKRGEKHRSSFLLHEENGLDWINRKHRLINEVIASHFEPPAKQPVVLNSGTKSVR